MRVGADDKFVRLHFTEAEAVTIDDALFTVFLPENMPELIRVRARWNQLNRQIVRHCPGLLRHDGSRWSSSARHVIRNRSSWPDVPAFVAVWAAGWLYSSMPAGPRAINGPGQNRPAPGGPWPPNNRDGSEPADCAGPSPGRSPVRARHRCDVGIDGHHGIVPDRDPWQSRS